MRNADDSGLSCVMMNIRLFVWGDTLLDREIEKLSFCLLFLSTVSLLLCFTVTMLSWNSSIDKILNLNEA